MWPGAGLQNGTNLQKNHHPYLRRVQDITKCTLHNFGSFRLILNGLLYLLLQMLELHQPSSLFSKPSNFKKKSTRSEILTTQEKSQYLHRSLIYISVYLVKHLFIWYRLCLNASGIVSTAAAEAITLDERLERCLCKKGSLWGYLFFGHDCGIAYIGDENGMCFEMHVGIIEKAAAHS